MPATWNLGELFILRHAGFPFDWLESLGIEDAALANISLLLDDQCTPAQRNQAEARYASERLRLRQRLHQFAQDPRVQEAVFLSSPDMFENVWVRYAAAPLRVETSAVRRVERQVYSYLQRFCAKNETTSFFGPIGLGEIAGDDEAIEFSPAAQVRKTFIAYWAVEALARRAAMEPALWPSLPIKRNPLFAIDERRGEAFCESIARTVPLSTQQLRVINHLTRTDRADAIAAQLGEPLEEIERVVRSLCEGGVLVRRLWFRSDEPDTLDGLRRALAALPASDARERWLDTVNRLDSLRARFEIAGLHERRTLLATMELSFTTVAQVPARRAGGRLYTDRLLINEEASSPFKLRIGARAAGRLAAALSPMLDLAAAQGARFHQECISNVCAAMGPDDRLDFLSYATALRSLAVDPKKPTPLDTGTERSAEIPSTLFGAPATGRLFALPDIALARRGSDAVQPVLATMHHHLLTPGWLFAFHPQPERAARQSKRWLDAEPRRLAELATGRHNKGYYSFPGERVSHATAEMLERGHRVHAAADLSVHRSAGHLTLRDGAGQPLNLYLPLSDLTHHPAFSALATPPLMKGPIHNRGSHTARLKVGSGVYQRERWSVSTDGWRALSGLALFIKVQEIKQRLQLPRFLFARVSSERKPFLVDTSSPFSAELLRHHAQGAAVELEEMSPAPDELWLRDQHGRYTFELRMQVDNGTSKLVDPLQA